MTVLAWHFLGSDGTLRGGTEPPADGVVLRHDGPVVPCESGLHASVRAIDALGYAPGPIVCRVKCGGTIVEHGKPVDKFACTERTILWRADATDALRAFARWCALSVAHLWDMPPVVRQYLETGDETLRSAADTAARAAWAAWSAKAAWSASAELAAWSACAASAACAAWAAWSACAASAACAAKATSAAQDAELERLLMALEPKKEVKP